METSAIAAAFRALGDPTRLRVYETIRGQEDICACRILEDLSVSQPTLSHHMKQLCAAGLVTCRKEGRWMHYTADPQMAQALAGYLSGGTAELATPVGTAPTEAVLP